MKTKIFIALLFSLMIIPFSCEKELVTPDSVDSGNPELAMSATEFSIETIGQIHNQKLEEYYNNLKGKIDQIGCNALQPSHFRQSLNDVVIKEIKGANAGQFKAIGYSNYDLGINSASINSLIQQQNTIINSNPNLSPAFKAFYSSFQCQSQTIGCIAQKDNYCNLCKGQVEVDLVGWEKKFALASINLFSSSYDYWTENLSKWHALSVQCGGPGLGNDVTPLSIGGADMGGLVSGGIVGALIGGTATLGVLTVPAWVAGAIIGGLAGSVGAGVEALWDWLW